MARQLVESSLFRVIYRIVEPESICLSPGRRKTVVADTLQEAIDRIREHEREACPGMTIEINEVVREGIQVWV